MLKELDKSYSSDNYYRLYQEMFTDFQKMANNLDFSISTTKLQLLKAYDALKRNFSALDEVNEKKKKAIKKSLIRDFIKSAKIPLCITSPSTTRTLGAATKGLSNKKSTSIPEKVEVTVRDEKGCIHERFAIIRELAAGSIILLRILSNFLIRWWDVEWHGRESIFKFTGSTTLVKKTLKVNREVIEGQQAQHQVKTTFSMRAIITVKR